MAPERIHTRQRLLDAAAELIWAGSYCAAGVDEICRAADVRKGSFYHYFPSKSELAAEALRGQWAQVRRLVFEPVFEAESRGIERLVSLIRAVDDVQREEHAERGVYLGCAFGNLGQEMAHQDETLRALIDEVFEGHVDYFERAIREAAEAGDIPPGDARARARRVLALMEGALLLAKVSNRPDRFSDLVGALPALAGAG